MYIKSDHIYFPNQIIKKGYLEIIDNTFGDVTATVPEGSEVVDYTDFMIIPGFIDQHLHGWGTGSFANDKSVHSINEMKKNLPYEGVTSFLATSGAEPISDIVEGIKNVSYVLNTQKDDGATCIGVHLEGPFINKDFKGMQREECCIDPSLDIMHEFMDAQGSDNVIKLMTIAPELPNAKEVIKYCNDHQIQLNIGHSAATFECISELKEYGLGGVTHMFSGMKGLHHRELGVAGSAMYYDDLTCEFAKQTGMTVKPEAFALIWKLKSKDKIIMTTDCGGIALSKSKKYHYIRKETFIPDGDYLIIESEDGSQRRIKRDNYDDVKDLELSYIKSIRNLIDNVHPSVHEIIKVTAENPAKYIHVYDKKGSLESGKDADFLVVDKDFNIKVTYCMGKPYQL
mgnify:CR=1 FL=1